MPMKKRYLHLIIFFTLAVFLLCFNLPSFADNYLLIHKTATTLNVRLEQNTAAGSGHFIVYHNNVLQTYANGDPVDYNSIGPVIVDGGGTVNIVFNTTETVSLYNVSASTYDGYDMHGYQFWVLKGTLNLSLGSGYTSTTTLRRSNVTAGLPREQVFRVSSKDTGGANCKLTVKGNANHQFVVDGAANFYISGSNAGGWTAVTQDGHLNSRGAILGVFGQNNFHGGTVELEYVDLVNNWNHYSAVTERLATGLGGAVHLLTDASGVINLSMKHCTIEKCYAQKSGSAMFIQGAYNSTASTVTMEDCVTRYCFTACSDADGLGAGYGGTYRTEKTGSGPNFNITMKRCSIIGNASANYAGAICYNLPNELKLDTCRISGNYGAAGGLYCLGPTKLDSCTIKNNYATSEGGGVYCGATTLAVNECIITGNSATSNGGGIFMGSTGENDQGVVTVTGTVVVDDNQIVGSSTENNVYVGQSDWRVVYIGPEGLDCGSSIGISNRAHRNFFGQCKGSTAVATVNGNNAYRNHYFFDDNGVCVPVNSATGYPTYPSEPYYDGYGGYLWFYDKSIIASNSDSWHDQSATAGTDYVLTGGYVSEVKTAAGLAYFSKDVLTHDYTGKTVTLSNDISLAGHNWEPIGYKDGCASDAHPFTGTFDGQGHTISDLNCPFQYNDVALFGYVGSGGVVKNLMFSGSFTAANATNLGGIVGELDGGTVYNCMMTGTLSGGTNIGALAGKITSGSVKNSFAISNNAAAGSGTVTNCYVRKASGGTSSDMGTATNVGSSGNTTGIFTETVTPYLYKHDDNKVGSASLLTLLNQWVDAQSTPADLAHWTRTAASLINGDYPLLKFGGMKCVGTKSGSPDALTYGNSFNTMLDTHNASGDNIFFWGAETGVTNGNGSASVYIDEDAALIHTSVINAYVGITLKDAAWHMFSPAISSAPLGINYNNDATVYPYLTPPTQYAFYPESTADGYFPSTDFEGRSYYSDYDYYCYYEPEWHWINFKRNTPSHWHEDMDPIHPNIVYHWDNNPNNVSSIGNETTLKPGKGYLLGVKEDTYLQSHGTLNPSNGSSDVTFPVTRKSEYRTGYNLIGNPYQAYLDFEAFAGDNSGAGKIWSSASSAFYLMLYGGAYHKYIYGASSNSLQAPRCLHPHQGFMVITENDNVDAIFKNSMRVLSSATAAPFRDRVHIDYPLVNLIVTDDDNKSDITTIELGRPDKGGAPMVHDLHSGKGSLYVNYDDVDYSIAFTQPGISEVAVRFTTDEETTFMMTWDMENGDFSYLHLIDNMTGSDIDCLQDDTYCFTARPSDYKSRFRLVFDYMGIEEPEPIEGPTHFAFQMGDALVVNGEGQLQMFDLTGRQIMTTNTYGTQSRVALPETGAGIYVLRMNGKNGMMTQKIVIE